MMRGMDVPIGLLGMACLGLVLWDIFQSIVVPARRRRGPDRTLRRAAGVARVAALGRGRVGVTRDQLLGPFAPASILLLVLWSVPHPRLG
jgi:hypothetical protein